MPTSHGPLAALVFVVTSALVAACGGAGSRRPRRLLPALATRRSPSSRATFSQDHFRRNPSAATDLGIHTYDDQIEDLSQAAIAAESQALKGFRRQVAAIDPATLTLEKQLDREQLVHAMDSGILATGRDPRVGEGPGRLQQRRSPTRRTSS